MDDIRSLERKRAYLRAQYGRSAGSGARAQTPTSTSGAGDLLELQRRRARLPQSTQSQTGGQESRAQLLQRYEAILAKMPEGSDGRRLLQRSINQLRNQRTSGAPGRAQARHSMMEKR